MFNSAGASLEIRMKIAESEREQKRERERKLVYEYVREYREYRCLEYKDSEQHSEGESAMFLSGGNASVGRPFFVSAGGSPRTADS